jgi:hypothetical protein
VADEAEKSGVISAEWLARIGAPTSCNPGRVVSLLVVDLPVEAPWTKTAVGFESALSTAE